MTEEYLLSLERFLPRFSDYHAVTHGGFPVLEGVAYDDDVIYQCLRCGEVHTTKRVTLAGELYKQIEQCGKDNYSDVYITYYYELIYEPEFMTFKFRLLAPKGKNDFVYQNNLKWNS